MTNAALRRMPVFRALDQHAPRHSGHFVGQSNAGLVFTSSRDEFHGPSPVFRRISGNHTRKCRTRPVNQQIAGIAITPLGDTQELGFTSGGVLARHKAEVCGKLPAVFEIRGYTGDSQQDSGGHNADADPAQGAAEYRLAFGVHAVHRETVLCQINADGGNGRLGFAIFYATRFMRAGPSHHYALLRKAWASFQLDGER